MTKLFPEGVSVRWLGHAFIEIGTPEALEKELAPYALKTQLLKPKPGELLI